MKKFNRVAIIGVGLIGGSLGLAIRKNHLAKEVVGVCRTPGSIRLAKRVGAIHRGTVRAVDAVKGADFVILATPISRIHPIARQIAHHLKPGCLVTEVASIKEKVIRDLEEILPKSVSFVGSHPLAGGEKSGVAHAAATLFEKAPSFVVPTRRSAPSAVRKVSLFWRALGADVILLSAKRHDEVVARMSHLPHVVASLLVLSAKEVPWVGRGFLDTTRIASSDPSLWRDILLSNRKDILKSLNLFEKRFKHLRRLIEKGYGTEILNTFKQAKRLRDRLIH